MKPDHRSSGNHPGVIQYKDKWYVFGFNFLLNFRQTDKHHERRSVCVAEITFNPTVLSKNCLGGKREHPSIR